MNSELNPYAPPGSIGLDTASFAKRYRVDASRITLREFCNLSGKPILGTAFWLLMKMGAFKFNRQIIDGPRPFTDEQCSIDELKEPVRECVLSIQDASLALGFHSPQYSVVNSSGIETHGAAIRMLHESSQMFLQIIASSSGSVMQSYQLLVSATKETQTVIVSSNGPPSFNPTVGTRVVRKTGVSLPTLLDFHRQTLKQLTVDLVRIDSLDVLGRLMDYQATQFFADKIKRGIYVPVPDGMEF